MYKLLIADDEAFERKAMRFILNKNFNNLEILDDATTGNEAISLSQKFKPNIVIMDIKMPEKNGLDAHKEISSFIPSVKTIILTAYDNFNFAQSAIKLGVVDYILKPVRPNELNASINKIISLINTEDSHFYPSKNLPSAKDPIRKALEYINIHCCENINLESVADYVHLNPQYFSRYFKNNTGVNFVEYVSKTRLKKAKKLLLSTNKSINRISLEVGYSDAAYFTKVFTKYEGISPHKYRLTEKKQSLDLNLN